MNETLDPLWQWLWALGLGAIALALSALQSLGLEGQIVLATFRSLLQLAVLGYVLAAVMSFDSPFPSLGLVVVLGAIATVVSRNRISQKVPGVLTIVALGGAIALGTVLAYALIWVIRPPVWYAPRYLIALAAMVLASSTGGAAIAGERLVSWLNRHRGEIETHLSLGATPEQACRAACREASRTAVLAHLGTMMVVGLGLLPTFTAGQLVAGISPLEAVGYELVLLLMQLVALLITVGWVTRGVARQFFTPAGSFLTY